MKPVAANLKPTTTRTGPGRSATRVALLLLLLAAPQSGHAGPDAFQQGTNAYALGDYATAATAFAAAAGQIPAAGTLQNLGLAEWQSGRRGRAILAWERSLWVDPFNDAARANLRFARKTAQLEAPELTWYEAASEWLPVNVWSALAAGCFWFAVAMVMLPRIFRWRRAGWHQALAAGGFAIFLLCLPALAGIHTRARIGFVLEKDTPLRLTPTADAQQLSSLPPGVPARWERTHGQYALIQTPYGRGWVERRQFSRICPD